MLLALLSWFHVVPWNSHLKAETRKMSNFQQKRMVLQTVNSNLAPNAKKINLFCKK